MPLLWDALEIQTPTHTELHFITTHFTDVLNTSVSSHNEFTKAR